MGKVSKKNLWMGIMVLVGVGFLIKLSLIVTGRFVFSWDFARDMLWLRKLTEAYEPMLVGAWGSLNGALFGALYYYLLLIPGILFQGEPRGAVLMVTILLSLIPLIVLGWGIKRFGTHLSVMWAGLFVLSPLLFRLSVYSFPQQLVPLVFVGFLIAQWEVLHERNHHRRWLFLLGLLAGLLFHFEPANAPAALFFGLLLAWWKNREATIREKWVSLSTYLAGGVLPLLPNILYDIRHEGVQFKAYVRLLSGVDESLGGYLPLGLRVVDRLEKFTDVLAKSLMEPEIVGIIMVGVLIGVLVFLKRSGRLVQKPREIKLLWLLLVNGGFQLVYFTAFTRLLKDYYLHFLPILSVFLAGLWLDWIYISQLKRLVYGVFLLMVFLHILMVVRFWQPPLQAQEYRIQQQAVDWVYEQSGSQPFKAYTYTPLVYDYPYQYLFSWYGYKKYGYIPLDYAYAPNQPEYVLQKVRFDEGKDTRDGLREPMVFAIVEPEEQVSYTKEAWFSRIEVDTLTLIKSERFENGIEVRMYETQSEFWKGY